jgi:mono/diheme cytochrome c family protein
MTGWVEVNMNGQFWQHLHGASTHLPIVLLGLSVVFDIIARRSRDDALRKGFSTAGFSLAAAGVLGGCLAIASGLAMTEGRMLGSGLERMHHLFVWPAFGLATLMVVVRLLGSRAATNLYLTGMAISSGLMLGAGYWGGQMLLNGPETGPTPPGRQPAVSLSALRAHGQDLFQLNCAHCHGTEAAGTEEGPSLLHIQKSNALISGVIRNGIKGQMPRFAEKFAPDDIQSLVEFLRTLDRPLASGRGPS